MQASMCLRTGCDCRRPACDGSSGVFPTRPSPSLGTLFIKKSLSLNAQVEFQNKFYKADGTRFTPFTLGQLSDK